MFFYGGPFAVAYRATADPRFAQFEAFRTARAEYEAEIERQQLARQRAPEAHWHGLVGVDFGSELAELLRLVGCAVRMTPRSGDRGVDLIVGIDGRRYLVQCKAHARPVGPAVMRELYGTLVADGATGAILATQVGVTRGAAEFAAGKPIVVWRLEHILAIAAAGRMPPRYLPVRGGPALP